jgi:hypothetical protein
VTTLSGLLLGGSTYNSQYDSWVPTNQFELFVPDVASCTALSPLTPPSANLANPIAFVVTANNVDNLVYCGYNPLAYRFVCLLYKPSGRDTIEGFVKGTWTDLTNLAT